MAREAAAIWQGLTEARGIDGRDVLRAHPDPLPAADDLENPDAFVHGQPELDISDLENPENPDPENPDPDSRTAATDAGLSLRETACPLYDQLNLALS